MPDFQWLQVVNIESEGAPANAVLRIAGLDANGYIQVGKPDANNMTASGSNGGSNGGSGLGLLINGPTDIPPNGYGQAYSFPLADILYDEADGTPATGMSLGTETGNWRLRQGFTGFTVIGGVRDGVVTVWGLPGAGSALTVAKDDASLVIPNVSQIEIDHTTMGLSHPGSGIALLSALGGGGGTTTIPYGCDSAAVLEGAPGLMTVPHAASTAYNWSLCSGGISNYPVGSNPNILSLSGSTLSLLPGTYLITGYIFWEGAFLNGSDVCEVSISGGGGASITSSVAAQDQIYSGYSPNAYWQQFNPFIATSASAFSLGLSLYTTASGGLSAVPYLSIVRLGGGSYTAGGGTTGTNGETALGTNYTCTTTLTNVGLSVTLPDPGTYLLYADIATIIAPAGGGGTGQILGRLFDSTSSVAVTPTTTFDQTETSTTKNGTKALVKKYTTTVANTVVNLQAQKSSGSGGATCTIDSSAFTSLGYVRLS